eukprot:350607-Chlamydomonas_euryale.AAC.1
MQRCKTVEKVRSCHCAQAASSVMLLGQMYSLGGPTQCLLLARWVGLHNTSCSLAGWAYTCLLLARSPSAGETGRLVQPPRLAPWRFPWLHVADATHCWRCTQWKTRPTQPCWARALHVA